ncbi:MAG: MBL fold metallo-hydrolase [Caldilineales bacterium]
MSDFAALQPGAPGVSRLHRITLPTPFAVGPVHVYLAEDDPLTLIDSGPDTEDALAALQAGLAALGYDVSDVRRVVITHSHVDHYGLAHRIAAAGGAEVLAHPLARPILEDWPESRARREGFSHEMLRAADVPAELAERTARLLRSSIASSSPCAWTVSWGMAPGLLWPGRSGRYSTVRATPPTWSAFTNRPPVC